MNHKIKIENDKWYTHISTSKRLIEKSIELIGKEVISEIIEPSSGNGSFSNILFDNYKNVKAYDIMPEESRIKKQDFIELELFYKENRMFIGNPPFGLKGTLSKMFLVKSMKNSDYVGYILPSSYYNSDYYWFKDNNFKCIYKEIIKDFGIGVNACYMLWKRVDNNPIIDFINKYDIKSILTSTFLSSPKKHDIIIVGFRNNSLTNNIYTKKGNISKVNYCVITTNSKELDDYIREILSNGYLKSLSGIKLYSVTKLSILNLLYQACKSKEFKINKEIIDIGL